MHKEVWCWNNIFWQTDRVFNIANLEKIMVWYCIVCETISSKSFHLIFSTLCRYLIQLLCLHFKLWGGGGDQLYLLPSFISSFYTFVMISNEVWVRNGPGHAKMCLMPYVNNKGADQPAHPCSLISTFIVCCLDSIMPLVCISEISRL